MPEGPFFSGGAGHAGRPRHVWRTEKAGPEGKSRRQRRIAGHGASDGRTRLRARGFPAGLSEAPFPARR